MLSISKKVNLGQYFTIKNTWLKPQIKDFLKNINIEGVLDPFAGQGDLLNIAKELGFKKTIGYDIDKNLRWEINDSLKYIPSTNYIVITNPPYLAKNSAKVKKSPSYKYFENNSFTDLYQIALKRCLESHNYVVAIVPESFLLSNLFTTRLYSVTVLEDNPFIDTDCPVCVACFNKDKIEETLVYKDDLFVDTLQNLKNKILIPNSNIKMRFNAPNGQIGVRSVDGLNNNDKIHFCLPNELNYPLNNIKHSSRSITVVKIDTDKDIIRIIERANIILEKFREDTHNLLLSPFKGNNREGKRRRRLDYRTARAILEKAISEI